MFNFAFELQRIVENLLFFAAWSGNNFSLSFVASKLLYKSSLNVEKLYKVIQWTNSLQFLVFQDQVQSHFYCDIARVCFDLKLGCVAVTFEWTLLPTDKCAVEVILFLLFLLTIRFSLCWFYESYHGYMYCKFLNCSLYFFSKNFKYMNLFLITFFSQSK